MIATCGHEIDCISNTSSWKEHDVDLEEGIVRTVAYGVLCDECLKLYESWGILLKTEKDEQDWLYGKE